MHDVHLTTLLLPWFPIILGVGVGGRLLGRGRGIGLGVICAVFWLLLVLASAPNAVWGHVLTMAALVAGASSIVAMGAWAGDMVLAADSHGLARRRGSAAGSGPPADRGQGEFVNRLQDAMQQYQEWFHEHRLDADPWIAFDELIRTTLRQTCGANRVRPYRALVETGELIPLRSHDAPHDVPHLSARTGIVGHVVTSGCPYVTGDAMHGDLIDQLADDTRHAPVWCFAIRDGSHRFGVVVVNELDGLSHYPRPSLRVMEKVVNLWWLTLREACIAREALAGDPVSGLHSREAFLQAADQSLADSYARGEPVALAVIAVERLRELNDGGRWETADVLVAEISAVLRRKVRSDDAVGRFDGSRFLVLLRRVDSELASLIVGQILSQMETVCRDESRWGCYMQLRCGLAGSGAKQPDARSLLSQALVHSKRAREENMRCVADLSCEATATGVAS